MIPVNPPPEPPDFDEKARQPGNAWLTKNPDPKKGVKDYWSPFKSQLADGFNNLCGYSAMYEPVLCCKKTAATKLKSRFLA
ncbi:hypothetical protein NIES4071_98320 [Calothrix sp. NIES-4071]|nr:hypothetical protein NIES4071_98320 [Calothrix sp. NIES-4071]BAZ64096.1 hypothetical protein NIES4105_98250 [Calothrix sp. NIES-4105]